LAGYARARGKLDFASVHEEVVAATTGHIWIKPEHMGFVSDYVAHLVAATFASVGRCGQTPDGYRFFSVEFPHPNDVARGRTKLAKELADALAPNYQHQIFGLMVWRFHNTSEAMDALKPLLVQFCSDEDEDVGAVRTGLRTAYAVQPDDKSYLFSQDGLRGGGSSWRDCVLDNLVCWWAVAQRLAGVLRDPATTPALWHDAFLREILGCAKCFGVYWAKFLCGDIGHMADGQADLTCYTMIGPGCFRLLEKWGLLFSGNAVERQRQGLQAVNELRVCVAAVFRAGSHRGVERAREGGLKVLTAHDIQCQTCEHKRATREGGLHSRLTSTRRALWPPCEACGAQEEGPATRKRRRAAGSVEAGAHMGLPPKKRHTLVVQTAPEAAGMDAPRAQSRVPSAPRCRAGVLGSDLLHQATVLL
jgi:hypothetical protein